MTKPMLLKEETNDVSVHVIMFNTHFKQYELATFLPCKNSTNRKQSTPLFSNLEQGRSGTSNSTEHIAIDRIHPPAKRIISCSTIVMVSVSFSISDKHGYSKSLSLFVMQNMRRQMICGMGVCGRANNIITTVPCTHLATIGDTKKVIPIAKKTALSVIEIKIEIPEHLLSI